MELSQLLQQQLQEQLSGGLMDVLSQQTGADRVQTTKASSAAISAMLGGLARNASTPDGANSLANALERDHDGSLLDMIGGLMKGGREAPGQGMPTGGGLTDLLSNLGGGGGVGGGLLGSLLGGMMQQSPSARQGGSLGGLLGGLMEQTRGNDGGGIGDLLGGLLGGRQANTSEQIPPQFRKTMDGGGILDHILGTRKEETAREISQNSGLSLNQVLPLMATLAPILMGMLGRAKKKTQTDAGGLGGALTDMVTQAQRNPQQQPPDLGLAGSLLDRNRDGSIMDDILGMGAKMAGSYFRGR